MLRFDKLLLLVLLVTVTSSMLYKRYKSRWSTLSSALSRTSALSKAKALSRASQLLFMRNQLDAAYKSRSRYGTRSPGTFDTCQAHPLTLELEPPLKMADQCSTISVLSFGCRGGCSSYSQMDHRNVTNIIHSCSCCRPHRLIVSVAQIPCSNGQTMKVPFKEALSCSCRPCYAEDDAKDIITLDDLLTKPAVDTSF